MKKSISILVLLALVTVGGAFAQGVELSAGGGLLVDYSANNGIEFGDSYIGSRTMSFGGFIFFDATYAELDVSFAYGSVTSIVDLPIIGSATADGGSLMQLGFTLLGKYPIQLSSITLFPLLGVGYNMVLSGSDAAGDDLKNAGDMSQLGILAGVGVDKNLTDALYLRGEALFQIRLASKAMSDAADVYSLLGDSASATLGMGPVVKIGVGYRF
jgi:outer membrane protein W